MEHLSMNTIANKVEKAEAIGRQYFRQIVSKVIPGYKELVFSDNQFSKWDGAVKGKKNTKYFVEIKTRNMASNRYNDYMIEEKKMNYLLEMYDKEGYIPLYVNFFEDGKALVWNLAEERDKVLQREYTSNRVTVNPAAGKVTRNRNMLLRDNAQFYDYKRM